MLTHTYHSMYDHQPHSNTTKVVLGSASDNINYVILKFYYHKILINSGEFVC